MTTLWDEMMKRILAVFAALTLLGSLNTMAQPLNVEEAYVGSMSCNGGIEEIGLRLTYQGGMQSAEGHINYVREDRRGSRRLMVRSSDGVNFTASGQYAGGGTYAFTRLGGGVLRLESPADYCSGTVDLSLKRSAINLDKVAPKAWIGKSPNTIIEGKTFWDVLQLTRDTSTLNEADGDWSVISSGCTFDPVEIINYRNSGLMEYPRLIASSKGHCQDGRETMVYAMVSAPALANASQKQRDIVWYGRTCSSAPSTEAYQFCRTTSDTFTCSFAKKSAGYSCHSPAPVVERFIDYQRQLQSQRSCQRQWNSCANPVNRIEGSVFSACFGASGAYETVCSGGPEDARLLGPPVLLSLPEGLGEVSYPIAPANPDAMVEVLDAMTGETQLVSAAAVAESRRKAAAQEAARQAEYEQRLAESAERRRAFEAEQAAAAERERQAEAERAAEAAANMQSFMTPGEGYSTFKLTTYTGKLKAAGESQHAMVVRYISDTPETGLEGFFYFALGEELGSDDCSGLLKLENGAPASTSLTYVNQADCSGEVALYLDGTRPALKIVSAEGTSSDTGGLSPMPTGSGMAVPMPNTWDTLLPVLGVE